MVLFLFLEIICVNILGESRKVNDKILVSAFKQAGATAVSKSSPQPRLAEVRCEALRRSVFSWKEQITPTEIKARVSS